MQHDCYLKALWTVIGAMALLCLQSCGNDASGYFTDTGGDRVIEIAYSFPDSRGYTSRDMGLPESITHRGKVVLHADPSNRTNGSGFTFAVAMHVIGERKLIDNQMAGHIKTIRRSWYCIDEESSEEGPVKAIESNHLGERVEPSSAKRGDIVQFWTEEGMGHSAIFIRWLEAEGKKVGFVFRSSQDWTDGISDDMFYFLGTGHERGVVDPERFYVGRIYDGKA